MTVLAVAVLVLSAGACIRGLMAYKAQKREALTIEEGLKVISARLLSRSYLETVLVVFLCGIISVLAAIIFDRLGWAALPLEMIFLAYTAVAIMFLIILWLRRHTADRAIRYLEEKSDSEAAGPGQSSRLKQLMRTYRYYQGTETRPALFGWLRRQLSLHILGIDLRAYIPFSKDAILKRTMKMVGYVALVTLFIYLTGEKGGAWDGYEMADGEAPSGDVEKSNNKSDTPDPDGTTARGGGETKNEESPSSPEETPEQLASASESPPSDSEQVGSYSEEKRSEQVKPEVPGAEAESAPDQQSDRQAAEEESLLDKLFSAVEDALFDGDDEGEKGPGSHDEAVPLDGEEQPTGATEQIAQGMNPQDAASGQTPATGTAQDGSPQDDAMQESRQQEAPPSQTGEGTSGESRISRGDGGNVLGQATTLPEQNEPNRAMVQLEVNNTATEEEGDKESEQMVRPPRYNAMHTLNPEDVTITPADPFMTQRVPSSYRDAIRKILTKP